MIWRKSTFSAANGACVELAEPAPGTVWVRDSKHPDAGHIVLSAAEFAALRDAAAAGEWDDLT
jgi:hypothetical protein